MTQVAGSYMVPPVSWSMRFTELARLAGSAVQAQATSQPGPLSDADVRDLAYDVQMLAAAADEWALEASRLAQDAKATAEHVLNKNLGTVVGSTSLQIELNRLAQHLYGIPQQEAEPGTTTEQSSHRTVVDGRPSLGRAVNTIAAAVVVDLIRSRGGAR
ncbi:hypothetical protein [Actinopolymorpha pittospori]|uniref:Uncharacterized protein n=1 Tax=Actinopolymorpha pittospori TaxID=648752 RepID=A0A927RDD3_9ACTN|nr:hypothetical protein [Actinopolymorpha pittospori]MBE1608025.1 hypothetical protein [Actinopolymorpha pittospori]